MYLRLGTTRLMIALACVQVYWEQVAGGPAVSVGERLRVIVETDAGGDPDDQASLVRFLLYANEWDVEGIIADRARTGNWPLKGEASGLELVRVYLDAYRRVHGNLVKHQPGYPSHEFLRRRTVAGHNDTDDAVKLIVRAVDRADPRPIWYGNWGSNSGSASNLKRALGKVKRERSEAAYRRFIGRLRICTLDGGRATKQGHDDLIPLHIETGYPVMDGGRWYHRFRPLTERAGGFDVRRDVQRDHGPLGAIYTTPKEGDSWTFVYLIPNGLSDPSRPAWGGWAGRYGRRGGDALNKSGPQGPQFYWANQRDRLGGSTHRDNTVARWAGHLQNDFKARLDWCVAERPADANHPPEPHCQGDATGNVLQTSAPVGRPYLLDARGTRDRDGDALSYRWYVYAEPGTYRGAVTFKSADSRRAELSIPADAAGKTIHVVLEVSDDGNPPLTRYRRLVVRCRP